MISPDHVLGLCLLSGLTGYLACECLWRVRRGRYMRGMEEVTQSLREWNQGRMREYQDMKKRLGNQERKENPTP